MDLTVTCTITSRYSFSRDLLPLARIWTVSSKLLKSSNQVCVCVFFTCLVSYIKVFILGCLKHLYLGNGFLHHIKSGILWLFKKLKTGLLLCHKFVSCHQFFKVIIGPNVCKKFVMNCPCKYFSDKLSWFIITFYCSQKMS